MPPELIDGVNGAQLRGEMFYISMILYTTKISLPLVASCNDYSMQLRESIAAYALALFGVCKSSFT